MDLVAYLTEIAKEHHCVSWRVPVALRELRKALCVAIEEDGETGPLALKLLLMHKFCASVFRSDNEIQYRLSNAFRYDADVIDAFCPDLGRNLSLSLSLNGDVPTDNDLVLIRETVATLLAEERTDVTQGTARTVDSIDHPTVSSSLPRESDETKALFRARNSGEILFFNWKAAAAYGHLSVALLKSDFPHVPSEEDLANASITGRRA